MRCTAEGRSIGLETSGGATAAGQEVHPRFFRGFLAHPQAAAAGLLCVADIARLGAAGRIGYDIAEAAYFHRELPYDTGRAEQDKPRLRAARALVDVGAVRLDSETAIVMVEDHSHRVRSAEGRLTCTCRWWAEYRGGRGPCKHALAVRIARRAAAPRTTTTAHDSADAPTGATR